MQFLTPYDAPRTLFVTHLRNFFCLSENSLPFADLLDDKPCILVAANSALTHPPFGQAGTSLCCRFLFPKKYCVFFREPLHHGCLSENPLPFADLLHRKTGIRDAGSKHRVREIRLHKNNILLKICLCSAHAVQKEKLFLRAFCAALAAKIFYLDNTFHDMFIITQNVQNVKMLKKFIFCFRFIKITRKNTRKSCENLTKSLCLRIIWVKFLNGGVICAFLPSMIFPARGSVP